MWISRIELSNFKSFMHQKLEFPKPENGRNLVLVGGLNGYGKTTLLEAIYLCLYGKDAVPHLARAGLTHDAYGKFIKKALHGNALTNGHNHMEVEIEFLLDDVTGYQISRCWYFDQQGRYDEEDLKVYKIQSSIPIPVPNEDLIEILDNDAVPAHIAPFFFFDGEEVKKLADQDRREWVQQGMENLLGIVLLRGLQKRLEEYQNNRKPTSKTSMDEAKLDQLFEELGRNEVELDELRKENAQLLEQQRTAGTRRDEIHQRLSVMGAGGGGVKQYKRLVQELGDLRGQLSKCEGELEMVLTERLPFHFVKPEIMNRLKECLLEEARFLEWQSSKQGLEPKRSSFVDAFFSTDFTRPLNEQTKTKLRESIDFAWQSLFYPKPEGCAKELLHDYLDSRHRQRITEVLSNISVGIGEIRELLNRRASLRSRISELEREQIRLEAAHDDGTLQQLQEDLRGVQSELDGLNETLGDLKRRIIEKEKTIIDQRALYEREHSKLVEASPIQSNIRKSERVLNLIKELMPRLFALKTRELSQAVTEIFKKLAHKEQVDRIEINEQGISVILSKEGNEIALDRSAGENQIFATALIAGLAKVSGYSFPMVVDTPLGRLDSLHRQRILDFWLSDATRQIVLLSQDKEIDRETFQGLQPQVSKTFLLRHRQVGKGIGVTSAYPNEYF